MAKRFNIKEWQDSKTSENLREEDIDSAEYNRIKNLRVTTTKLYEYLKENGLLDKPLPIEVRDSTDGRKNLVTPKNLKIENGKFVIDMEW